MGLCAYVCVLLVCVCGSGISGLRPTPRHCADAQALPLRSCPSPEPHLWLHRRRGVLLPPRQAWHCGVPVRPGSNTPKGTEAAELNLLKQPVSVQQGPAQPHTPSDVPGQTQPHTPGALPAHTPSAVPAHMPWPAAAGAPAGLRPAWASRTATPTASALRRSGWSCRRRGGSRSGTDDLAALRWQH